MSIGTTGHFRQRLIKRLGLTDKEASDLAWRVMRAIGDGTAKHRGIETDGETELYELADYPGYLFALRDERLMTVKEPFRQFERRDGKSRDSKRYVRKPWSRRRGR